MHTENSKLTQLNFLRKKILCASFNGACLFFFVFYFTTQMAMGVLLLLLVLFSSGTLLLFLTSNYFQAWARNTCVGLQPGFYCIDSLSYAWCYGVSIPASFQCPSGTECRCGFTTNNPCDWSYLPSITRTHKLQANFSAATTLHG